MMKTYFAILLLPNIPKKEFHVKLFNDNTSFILLVIPVSSLSLTAGLYTTFYNDSSSLNLVITHRTLATSEKAYNVKIYSLRL